MQDQSIDPSARASKSTTTTSADPQRPIPDAPVLPFAVTGAEASLALFGHLAALRGELVALLEDHAPGKEGASRETLAGLIECLSLLHQADIEADNAAGATVGIRGRRQRNAIVAALAERVDGGLEALRPVAGARLLVTALLLLLAALLGALCPAAPLAVVLVVLAACAALPLARVVPCAVDRCAAPSTGAPRVAVRVGALSARGRLHVRSRAPPGSQKQGARSNERRVSITAPMPPQTTG